MLDQVRTRACSRNQHTAAGEKGVLIHSRMNSYHQTVSKQGLQKATSPPAQVRLVGQTVALSSNGLSSTPCHSARESQVLIGPKSLQFPVQGLEGSFPAARGGSFGQRRSLAQALHCEQGWICFIRNNFYNLLRVRRLVNVLLGIHLALILECSGGGEGLRPAALSSPSGFFSLRFLQLLPDPSSRAPGHPGCPRPGTALPAAVRSPPCSGKTDKTHFNL